MRRSAVCSYTACCTRSPRASASARDTEIAQPPLADPHLVCVGHHDATAADAVFDLSMSYGVTFRVSQQQSAHQPTALRGACDAAARRAGHAAPLSACQPALASEASRKAVAKDRQASSVSSARIGKYRETRSRTPA